MAIELRHAIRNMVETPEHPGFDHGAAIVHAEDLVVPRQAGCRQLSAHRPCQGKIEEPGAEAPERAIAHRGIGLAERLDGDADRRKPKGRGNLRNGVHHNRVHVEMLVTVDVVERQARLPKTSELRLYFIDGLAAQRRREEERNAETHRIIGEASVGTDKARDSIRRKDWMTLNQGQMQPDAKRRQGAGTPHRILPSWRPYHEAGRRENSAPGSLLDGLIYGHRQSEVVGRHDERLHSDPLSQRHHHALMDARTTKSFAAFLACPVIFEHREELELAFATRPNLMHDGCDETTPKCRGRAKQLRVWSIQSRSSKSAYNRT